jgi:hypothetical protein
MDENENESSVKGVVVAEAAAVLGLAPHCIDSSASFVHNHHLTFCRKSPAPRGDAYLALLGCGKTDTAVYLMSVRDFRVKRS